MQVDLEGARCGCGGVGHVEALASGRAIALAARAGGRRPAGARISRTGRRPGASIRSVPGTSPTARKRATSSVVTSFRPHGEASLLRARVL